MSKPKDPLHQAMVQLMDSITDATEWEEKRIGLFYADSDKFVAMLPTATHFGAVAALCRKFDLDWRLIDVTVTYTPKDNEL